MSSVSAMAPNAGFTSANAFWKSCIVTCIHSTVLVAEGEAKWVHSQMQALSVE